MARSGVRLGRLMRSAFDALLAPAPDPRAFYAEPSARQRALLEQVQAAARRLGETRGRLETRRDETARQTMVLETQARRALADGREDLAREALHRGAPLAGALAQLDRQIAGLREDEARLAAVASQIAAQIDLLTAREQLAAARHTVAQARVAVGEALSGLSEPDGASTIERVERETAHLQARAEAIEELLSEGFFGATGHDALATPAVSSDREIEARLAALAHDLTGSDA